MNDLSSEKDARAVELLGKGFLKMPRGVGKLFFSEKRKEHLMGVMYFSLICLCNFADGQVVLNGIVIPCKAGEYVCTHRLLSEKTHIRSGSISRTLSALSDLNLIETSQVEGISRIRVCGYAQFILPQEKEKSSLPPPTKPQALPDATKKNSMRDEEDDETPEIQFT